jgi:flagellar biosynthesis/type III secretory pathway protein FliH
MEGMNAAKLETAQSMHQVERIFQETQLWQEQVMRQSQGRIIEMVVEIGRKLFGGGFELPAEQIDHIVSRAISEGSRLGDLRIYLNPEDSKTLVNLWQESEITVNGQRIQIVSSQNISRGGCFVDGQFGIVDGRVEEQMDQIVETLKPVLSNLELEDE